MKIKANLSLFLSFFLLFHVANAFNITQILTQYPDFSSFNTYLTQANVAGKINSRETITVLVVENSNLSPISGKSPQVLANIMSVHVILDYFDVQKLQKLPNGPTQLTTLFQTTSLARGQQGFLNVTHLSTSSVAFGSAVAGSAAGSNLVKPVFTEPYNISVLQVSNIIVPPGVDGPASPIATPPTSSGAPASSETIGATPASAPSPSADGPAADAPAAAMGPAADSPAATETPAGDSPSAGTTLSVGLAVVYTLVVSTLCLASRI
ncbi:fasciclin-like arabinogalactan protein 2 [Phtheirospermum japonicum]|uniref:Fasciclin-like arabinogalactan protein 2 n=1 Tax=Phtheirospermum japonicum TaxID=374723 RepID=A0A830CVJ2_9LAMI|nr:fasciclin-like arabinogalactan protein 2 [Phtheirospermum japonicum]